MGASDRFRIGESLLVRGQHAAAIAALNDAKALVGAEDPPELASAIDARVVLALRLAGRYDAAIETAKAALAGAEAATAVEIASAAAMACWAAGRWSECEAFVKTARAKIAAVASPSRAHVALLRAEGNLALARDQAADAKRAFNEGLGAALAVGDRWEASIALYNLGEALVVANDDVEAEKRFREALAMKEEVGDTWGTGGAHGALALLYLRRGDVAAARVQAETGLRKARATDDRKLVAILHCVAADVDIAGAQKSSALSHARRGLDAANEAGAAAEIERARALLSRLSQP